MNDYWHQATLRFTRANVLVSLTSHARELAPWLDDVISEQLDRSGLPCEQVDARVLLVSAARERSPAP